jgi:4-hydroxybenzoate polyprenyltransferase
VNFYRRSIALFGLVFIGLGIALLVVTVVHGGGAVGYLIGVLFVALGIGRLYLLRARR